MKQSQHKKSGIKSVCVRERERERERKDINIWNSEMSGMANAVTARRCHHFVCDEGEERVLPWQSILSCVSAIDAILSLPYDKPLKKYRSTRRQRRRNNRHFNSVHFFVRLCFIHSERQQQTIAPSQINSSDTYSEVKTNLFDLWARSRKWHRQRRNGYRLASLNSLRADFSSQMST